ncbi:MAG: glycosyl transferase family 1 [Acinetobacter gandensis]|uniref:glycosyl transferase family 1 n=1 Tax=Acinetobacter gandensis TaxID=1443941 RepID=UPI003D04EA74
MSKILMILKTQNLRNDQRVLKEMKSLTDEGANVNVFVSKNCDTTEEELGYPMKEINIIGGAAPKNTLIRMIGVVVFYIKCMFYLAFRRKKFDKVWICDPIMFGLVLLIKLFFPKIKVIWDHHELPPDWFSNSKILMFAFKFAYRKSDVVIHCNNARKNYLESKIKFNHFDSFIINNVPQYVEIEEEELVIEAEKWLKQNSGKIVYLQNSLQDDRNGSPAIKAILSHGYKIFHAGTYSEKYLREHKINVEDLFLGGYLTYKQINRILNHSIFTVVLYKMNSTNQIYCDPNRLYQAINLGVPVIVGNNPSMVEILSVYDNKVILADDGSNQYGIEEAITLVMNKKSKNKRFPMSWKQFDSIFKKIVAK